MQQLGVYCLIGLKEENYYGVRKMSKYYSPRDWDIIGFGNSRRYVWITDEERRKRVEKKKLKQRKKKKKNYYETD